MTPAEKVTVRRRAVGNVLILIFFLIIVTDTQAIKITIRIKIKTLPGREVACPSKAAWPLSARLKILVAITGASGALYAQRLLDNLDPAAHEIHVVQSHYAAQVIAEELPGGLRLPAGVKMHGLKSMNAPFASGSNPPDRRPS